jgi:uncharacterized protein YfdQ (DUF2303 family)
MSQSEHNIIETAIAAGFDSAECEKRCAVINDIPVAIGADGGIEVLASVLKAADERAGAPLRRKGNAKLGDLKSFLSYTIEHRDSRTEVWLDALSGPVPRAVAVLNGADGWGDDRAEMALIRSSEWLAWQGACDKPMTQEGFADFLESRFEEVLPAKEGGDHAAPLALLQMLRDLQINTVGTFKRKIDKTSGTGSLIWETEHGPGSTTIPKAFRVALRPWEGGDAFAVEVRVRFELKEKEGPRFTLTMHRATEVWMEAFRGLVGHFDTALNKGAEGAPTGPGTPVFVGSPPAPRA